METPTVLVALLVLICGANLTAASLPVIWSGIYGTWPTTPTPPQNQQTLLCPAYQYVVSFSAARHRTSNGRLNGDKWITKLYAKCSSGQVLAYDAQPANPASGSDILSTSIAPTGFTVISIASGWAINNILGFSGSDGLAPVNFNCPSGYNAVGFSAAAQGYTDGWIVGLSIACSPLPYTWSGVYGVGFVPQQWPRSVPTLNLCPWHQVATKFSLVRHRTSNGRQGGNTWVTKLNMTCSGGTVLSLDTQPANPAKSGDYATATNNYGFSNVNVASGWAVNNLFDLPGNDGLNAQRFNCPGGQFLSGFYGAGIGYPDGWIVDLQFACS